MNLTVKVFFGLIFTIISIFFGYKLSEKYKIRKEFYSDYYNFNQKMIEEVNFRKNSILNIINKFSSKLQFNLVLNEYKNYLHKNTFNPSLIFLSETEKEDVITYFTSLGKNDTKNELNLLKNYDIKLKELKNNTEIENKKYKSLYLKLGFLFGILIFVLII